MIRTSQLHGRSVVDVDSATKLGEIDELFLDIDRMSIVGMSVARGGGFLSGDEHVLIPANAVHSIGDDAVMVHGGQNADGIELTTRASSLAGRSLVTESGTKLGDLDDIIYDEESGRVIGYAFAERRQEGGGGLAGLFGHGRRHDSGEHDTVDYVRASAELRIGGDLIVVPDDAVVRNEKLGAMGRASAVRHADGSAPSANIVTVTRVAPTERSATPIAPAGQVGQAGQSGQQVPRAPISTRWGQQP